MNYVKVGLRKARSFVTWPRRYLKERERLKREKATRFDDVTRAISAAQGEVVVMAHGAWMGVHTATDELFDNVVNLPEIEPDDDFSKVIEAVACNKNIKKVFFAAFAPGWERFALAMREASPDIIMKVIWHGSNAMHYEDFDWGRFSCVFELLNDGVINKVVFVKKSMYEQYKKLGYNVGFLGNTVHIRNVPKRVRKDKGIRVGLYASSNRWLKNFYNQMAAVSLIDGAVLDIVPLNKRAKEFAEILKLKLDGVSQEVKKEELFRRVVNDDVVVYVSFVECAPMLPLECLELGVPCITGDNHHYWEGTPLEEYLVEPRADDPVAIAKKIENCIKNKDTIIKLYKDWKKSYDRECEEYLAEVLKSE